MARGSEGGAGGRGGGEGEIDGATEGWVRWGDGPRALLRICSSRSLLMRYSTVPMSVHTLPLIWRESDGAYRSAVGSVIERDLRSRCAATAAELLRRSHSSKSIFCTALARSAASAALRAFECAA